MKPARNFCLILSALTVLLLALSCGSNNGGDADADIDSDVDGDNDIDIDSDADTDSDSNSVCEGDQDCDGFPDDTDNCPAIANKGQYDSDHDGCGLLCDWCGEYDAEEPQDNRDEYSCAISCRYAGKGSLVDGYFGDTDPVLAEAFHRSGKCIDCICTCWDEYRPECQTSEPLCDLTDNWTKNLDNPRWTKEIVQIGRTVYLEGDWEEATMIGGCLFELRQPCLWCKEDPAYLVWQIEVLDCNRLLVEEKIDYLDRGDPAFFFYLYRLQ